MHRSQKLAYGVALLAAAACGLPSADEFAAGKQASGNDAGGGSSGTTSSGGVTDGGPSGTDSGGDAGDRDDGGGGIASCPQTALFCETFEGNFSDQWTLSQTGGTVTSGDGKTGRGLVAHVDEHPGPDRHDAYLLHQLTLAPRTPFTVSFDLMYTATQGVGIVDVDFFRVQTPFYRVGLRVAPYGSGYFLREYGDPINGGAAVGGEGNIQAVPPNKWTRVAMSVTYDGNDVHGLLTYDGAQVFDSTLMMGAYIQANPFLLAGIASTENAGDAVTVSIDNFVVTSP